MQCSSPDSINKNVTSSIEYIEDVNGAFSFQDIQNTEVRQWQKVGQDSFNFKFSKSVFWLKIDLGNYLSISQNRMSYLVFAWKALDSVELFYVNRQGKIETQIAGDMHPKSTWSLPEAHFPAFSILPRDNPRHIYYVRLDSLSIKNFPVFYKSDIAYLHDLKAEIMVIMVFKSVIFVLLFFAGFLFIMSRDINYLLYLAYLLSISLAQDVTFGNAFDLFWPNSTWWQNRAGMTFIGGQLLFSLLFVRRLLDFQRFVPLADNLSKSLAVVCAISIPLTLTDIPISIFSHLYTSIYWIVILSFFGIGIYLLSRTVRYVRFFVIGWGIFFFFAIFQVLYFSYILPYHPFYVYAPILAIPVDILFLFMSIWEKQQEIQVRRMLQVEKKMQALHPAHHPLQEKQESVNSAPVTRYQKSSLVDVDVELVLRELDILVRQEKIYLVEGLRLPELSRLLRLNRTQLSELLNTRFGMTFSVYINQLRIEEAKRQLLSQPDKRIIDIAFDTGFGSKASFCSVFQNLTGVSASDYRNKKTP
ncbi:MAG: helix-turn-helix domain-containing protein [Spirochaetia bacterium]|nr:helix-turn-helix domain-containing protein [Spirochaetia bacterium]